MEKLRFAILGYGRMGHIVQKVLEERNEIIGRVIDHATYNEFSMETLLEDIDCAICFVSPESGYEVTVKTLKTGTDIVVGTTKFYLTHPFGMLNHKMLNEFANLAKENNCRMIYASNFATGMNAFWEITRMAAKILAKLDYDVAVEERHHNRKVDVSGTAKTIGNILVNNYLGKKLSLNFGDARRKRKLEEIMISSVRVGNIPGTHTVIFDSPVDTIELIHRVRDPRIFAIGAIESAYWLREQPPGLYEIRDRF